MDADLRKLAKQLSEILQDYAVAPVTCDTVVEWIQQFGSEDRVPILNELVHVLRKTYISRERAKNTLSTFLDQMIAQSYGGDARRFAAETSFLSIQEPDESQCDLLKLADEILQERHNLTITAFGQGKVRRFIYLDDSIFTGNKLRYDLVAPPNDRASGKRGWLSDQAPNGSILHIFVLIAHSAGLAYARRHIEEAANQRDVRVRFDQCLLVNNARKQGVHQHECLWPSSHYDNQRLRRYIKELCPEISEGTGGRMILRPADTPRREQFFSSAEARERLEKAFVLRGLELMERSSIPSLRPLGFEKLISLGFGTLAIPYRNCPNNAPLVLWWRSGGWKPLLQRRDHVQEQCRSLEGTEGDPESIPW
jgi:hypothetical protein